MSTKTITYADMVVEILSRVNDAGGDVYLERAKELIYEGISSLAVSEGVSPDDIRGLIKSDVIDVSLLDDRWRIRVKGSTYLANVANYIDLTTNPAKIINIIDDLTVTEAETADGITEHRYVKLSLAEVNRLNDSDYRPFNDEIFYYDRGDYVYFYPKERMNTQILVVTYIAEPDLYTYEPAQQVGGHSPLHDDFSLSFLYKTIDYSVGRIREQQSGE